VKTNYLAILLFCLLVFSCAKQSAPTGGPKDEKPPVVQEMVPADQSLNTKPEKIILTFDEYIKVENANRNIIVTPRIDKDKVVFTANKNQLIIELNQELEDSTTYVFNFQKAVQDLSESNPAENLKLVFSTGNSIDSLNFEGKVNRYFPDKRSKITDAIVGLYPIGDTTDVFIASPYYLSQVDSSGNFKITNIKSGLYKAYAWLDENNSLKAEYKSEAFDFIKDTVFIENDITGTTFNLSKGDQNPINLIRSSTANAGYTFVLNKDPLNIQLENDKLGEQIFYTKEEKKINLFTENPIPDSLQFHLQIEDSVGYKIDTLVWTKFEASDRKPIKLSVTPNSGLSFYRNLPIELTFNKPIIEVNFDSLYLTYDTASIIPIKREMVAFEDSLRRDKLLIKLNIPDSIPYEIFTITAADSTFRDIQNQYNEDVLKANYKKLKRETLADAISGRIEGAAGPFIVQLLDSKGVLKQLQYIEEGNKFSFKLIEATNYQIQVIEDSNGNRRWDPANYSENRNAERVFYYEDLENKTNTITVRGGWTLEDIVIQATPATGIPSKN